MEDMEVTEESNRSPKRQLDTFDESSPSKRIAYSRHHVIRHKLQTIPSAEPVFLERNSVDKLLFESIKSICEEEASIKNIDGPIIESVALEGLMNATEEFILKFCSLVRQYMLAARRTAPIATDFDGAIEALNLPRLDDQLRSYQTNPKMNPSLLPTPPPDTPFHNIVKLPNDFLGSDSIARDALKRFSSTPSSLPPLPSSYTYKTTPVYSDRETDSRKIREIATEEGKLGEQALRRLAGAARLDVAQPVEHQETKPVIPSAWPGKRRRKVGLSEEAVFDETVRELLKDEPNGFELGPIVTSEKAYRMPDDAQVKRKPAINSKSE